MYDAIKKIFLALGIWALLCSVAQASAVETENATVTLTSDSATVHADRPFWLALHFELKDGWHIYWQNPGDSGLAARLQWDLPEGFETQAIHWPAPQRILVEGLMNFGYEEQATLLIPVIPPKDLPPGQVLTFGLNAGWLICKDICVPESGDFLVQLQSGAAAQPGPDAAMVTQALQALPQLVETPMGVTEIKGRLQLEITLPQAATPEENDIREVYFYPKAEGILRYDEAPRWARRENILDINLPRDALPLPQQIEGVLEVKSAAGVRFYDLHSAPVAVPSAASEPAAAMPQPAQAEEALPPLTLLQAVFFAFLGGVLLNAMPCVFPVLALKALSVSRKAQAAPALVRRQGLAYLAGAVLTFLLLSAALILLKQGGEALGWGFQLQSPAFVAVMVYAFLLLGLALSGMFEIPLLFGALGGEAATEDSAKGSFLTGMLAVMVATPCTVPFMAPAIGYAFAQSAITNLLVMVALGAGLAFPYVLISFFPPLLRLLPKPGAWMATFKQFMAFPMFATAAWLLWVLVQQTGAAGLAVVLSIAILLVFLIWLGKRHHLPALLWLAAAGLVGYSSYLLTPHQPLEAMLEETGYTVEPFSVEKLEALRKEGRPVFVNATAAWCITCKVNERVALRSEGLAKAFKERGVTYLVADWTNYNDEITRYLQGFDRQGVPLYVYYPPQGEPRVLPQLLTESIVLEHVKEGE